MADDNQRDEQQGGAKEYSGAGQRRGESKGKTVTKTDAGGQAQAVKGMLTKIETKMKGNKMKATLGDYIRLASGQLFGAYMPAMVPEVPTFDDAETRLQWKFQNSRAQGAVNDELYIAFA